MAGVLSAPDVATPAQLQLSVVLSRQLQSTACALFSAGSPCLRLPVWRHVEGDGI